MRTLTIRVRDRNYVPATSPDVAGRLLPPAKREFFACFDTERAWSRTGGHRLAATGVFTVPGRSQRRTPPGMASAGHRNCTRYLNIGERRGSAPRSGGSDPTVRPRLRANPSDLRRSWHRRVATLPSRPSSFIAGAPGSLWLRTAAAGPVSSFSFSSVLCCGDDDPWVA